MTPIEAAADAAVHGAHAAPEPQPAPPHGLQPQAWMTAIPRWFRVVWRDGAAAVSHMEPVATNPLLDELIEEALTSAGAGVAAQVFEGAIDSLRGARKRQVATGQADGPQPLPAPASGDGAM